MVNFYASSEYLSVIAGVYFNGQDTCVKDVQIDDEVLRLLVVDGKRVITNVQFLDYHEPLQERNSGESLHGCNYANPVVRDILDASEWDPEAFPGCEPAPFVDWSKFPTFEDYENYLKSRQKGLYKEQKRRRRRLAETHGELVFSANDEADDVFDLARQWKSKQLRDTGVKDYFADSRNIEYFNALRQKGLLTSSTLRAGTRLISVWIGFVHQGVWSGWVFTYDPDPSLRKYSAGHQLLHSMLEESHRRNHREFDFSIGNEDYKWFYSTNFRLLGPVGRVPLWKRTMARAEQDAKQLLSRWPALHAAAASLKRKLQYG